MIAQRRDKNEPEIIQALRAAGCGIIQMDRLAGFDLLAFRNGQHWIIEVKMPGKELHLTNAEASQYYRVNTVYNTPYYVVSSVEQALEIVGR
jgi:Holliday junction resolvase